MSRRAALPQPTEKQWQRTVTDLLDTFGWKWFHPFDVRRSREGWPDLFACKDGKALALELKTQTGKVRPEQFLWIAELDAIPGITARILRPSDWDELERLVRG